MSRLVRYRFKSSLSPKTTTKTNQHGAPTAWPFPRNAWSPTPQTPAPGVCRASATKEEGALHPFAYPSACSQAPPSAHAAPSAAAMAASCPAVFTLTANLVRAATPSFPAHAATSVRPPGLVPSGEAPAATEEMPPRESMTRSRVPTSWLTTRRRVVPAPTTRSVPTPPASAQLLSAGTKRITLARASVWRMASPSRRGMGGPPGGPEADTISVSTVAPSSSSPPPSPPTSPPVVVITVVGAPNAPPPANPPKEKGVAAAPAAPAAVDAAAPGMGAGGAAPNEKAAGALPPLAGAAPNEKAGAGAAAATGAVAGGAPNTKGVGPVDDCGAPNTNGAAAAAGAAAPKLKGAGAPAAGAPNEKGAGTGVPAASAPPLALPAAERLPPNENPEKEGTGREAAEGAAPPKEKGAGAEGTGAEEGFGADELEAPNEKAAAGAEPAAPNEKGAGAAPAPPLLPVAVVEADDAAGAAPNENAGGVGDVVVEEDECPPNEAPEGMGRPGEAEEEPPGAPKEKAGGAAPGAVLAPPNEKAGAGAGAGAIAVGAVAVAPIAALKSKAGAEAACLAAAAAAGASSPGVGAGGERDAGDAALAPNEKGAGALPPAEVAAGAAPNEKGAVADAGVGAAAVPADRPTWGGVRCFIGAPAATLSPLPTPPLAVAVVESVGSLGAGPVPNVKRSWEEEEEDGGGAVDVAGGATAGAGAGAVPNEREETVVAEEPAALELLPLFSAPLPGAAPATAAPNPLPSCCCC